MKIEITEEYIKLIPETSIEHSALHETQYRGVKGTQLVGELPHHPELKLMLGPDYLSAASKTTSS